MKRTAETFFYYLREMDKGSETKNQERFQEEGEKRRAKRGDFER